MNKEEAQAALDKLNQQYADIGVFLSKRRKLRNYPKNANSLRAWYNINRLIAVREEGVAYSVKPSFDIALSIVRGEIS